MEKETYFWISWVIAGIVWCTFSLARTRNEVGYLTYKDLLIRIPACALCGWLLVIATVFGVVLDKLETKKLLVKMEK